MRHVTAQSPGKVGRVPSKEAAGTGSEEVACGDGSVLRSEPGDTALIPEASRDSPGQMPHLLQAPGARAQLVCVEVVALISRLLGIRRCQLSGALQRRALQNTAREPMGVQEANLASSGRFLVVRGAEEKGESSSRKVCVASQNCRFP